MRTTRPGAAALGVSEGYRGTGVAALARAVRLGVQRPAQQIISSVSRVAPAAVWTCPSGQACHAALGAGQEGGAVGGRGGDQTVDQRLGQDVGLGREPGGGGSRRGRAERGLKLGRLGQGNEAGGVGPVGQALDSGG